MFSNIPRMSVHNTEYDIKIYLLSYLLKIILRWTDGQDMFLNIPHTSVHNTEYDFKIHVLSYL